MKVISCIDDVVNAIPRTPAKQISKIGDGRGADGIMYLPVAGAIYTGLCAAQGAAVGVGLYSLTNNTNQAIVGAVAATIAPPITWMVRNVYNALAPKK